MQLSPEDEAGQVIERCTAAASKWLPLAPKIERMLQPMSDELFAAARITPGEMVIDIGCGSGPTTLEAARLAGAGGKVIGCDAARNVVEYARSRPVLERSAPIEWVVGDAQRHPFEIGAADVIISRLGVMTFDDSHAAFANLARACRSGGRLCAVVWAPREESEFHQRALGVAIAASAAHGWHIETGPGDSGPFSLGTERAIAILREAGWSDPVLDKRGITLVDIGATPETVADEFVAKGLWSSKFDGASQEVVDAVKAAISVDLKDNWDATGVSFGARIVILKAIRQ